MSPSSRRPFTWAVLGLTSLVILGVYVQVYLIAVYILDGNADALDAHAGIGNVVFAIEVLVLVAALVGFRGQRRETILAVGLVVAGVVLAGLIQGDNEWVRGFHGVMALVVLVLAHAIVQHAVKALGLGGRATP